MKYLSTLIALCLSSSVFASGTPTPANPHAGMMQGNPHAAMSSMPAPDVGLTQKGTVLNVTNVAEYTYIEVSQDGKPRWLAATKMALKKGDVIRFDDGMVMTNFYSKTLKRSFPSIAFVNRVEVSNAKK